MVRIDARTSHSQRETVDDREFEPTNVTIESPAFCQLAVSTILTSVLQLLRKMVMVCLCTVYPEIKG